MLSLRMKSTLTLSFLAALPYVAAHGFVSKMTIDGQAYPGNVPNAKTNPSIIRQIDDISPVKGANNTYLNCGQAATLASLVANANPGSVVTFTWNSGNLGNWPHNTGPMMTYMASCGSTPCNSFDSQNAQWFKIDQLGQQENGTWVQQDVMNGTPANVTIPSNIAPGNYIVRHEILALQLAVSIGGAEFYPSCSQLTIGGSGTGAPTASELVSFPGAYSDTDPGIYDPSVYDNTGAPYVFPGPPVASFVGSSSSGSGTPSNSTATATATSASPSGSASSNNGSSTCHLKKQTSTTPTTLLRRRPHYISRVMRSIRH